MNREQIISYQEAHRDWLRASYSGQMDAARQQERAIQQEAAHDEDFLAWLGAVLPEGLRACQYHKMAAQANHLLEGLFTRPANHDTLIDKFVEIDNPYFLGRKPVRQVVTPTFGSFHVSENKAGSGSYAIEWAYPEDDGVPVLLHSDMRGYWPINAPTVPLASLVALDGQLETVRAICEDIGV